MLLAQLLAGFQSLPLLPTSKLGPPVADSWVGGFVYILGPCGCLQQTLQWGWEFLLPPNPHRFFHQRFWGFISLCWNPGLCGLSCSTVVPPCLSSCKCGIPCSASCHLALHLGCLSPPLLLVWMKVFSLTPWLSDFHTVRFSGSSCYFLFINLLSFSLCEEAKCISVIYSNI